MSPAIRHHYAGEDGFTLVEAMVSLFMLGLISAAAVAMLAQGANTQGRVTAANDALREIQSLEAIWSADLAQAVRASPSMPGQAAVGLEGTGAGAEDDRRIVFMRLVGDIDPEAANPTRLMAVTYEIDPEGGILRTVGEGAGTYARRFLPEADGIRFEFHNGVRWSEEWPPTAGALPRAVAMSAELPGRGPVRIAALVGM
jgi:general secretion pathway protein J